MGIRIDPKGINMPIHLSI